MRNGLKTLLGALGGVILALLSVGGLSANIQSLSVVERVMAGGTMGGGVLGMLAGLLFWALVVALVVGLVTWLVTQARHR